MTTDNLLDELKYWKSEAKRLSVLLEHAERERDEAIAKARESGSAEFALRSEVRDLRDRVDALRRKDGS